MNLKHSVGKYQGQCQALAPDIADLTGLVDLLKDWMKIHQQQLSCGLPMPVFDRQVMQPVLTLPLSYLRPLATPDSQ